MRGKAIHGIASANDPRPAVVSAAAAVVAVLVLLLCCCCCCYGGGGGGLPNAYARVGEVERVELAGLEVLLQLEEAVHDLRHPFQLVVRQRAELLDGGGDVDQLHEPPAEMVEVAEDVVLAEVELPPRRLQLQPLLDRVVSVARQCALVCIVAHFAKKKAAVGGSSTTTTAPPTHVLTQPFFSNAARFAPLRETPLNKNQELRKECTHSCR